MVRTDLTDKDAILVSLYDDLNKLEFDLTILLSFHSYASATLSLLEKEFNSSFELRHTRRKDENIDFTQLMEAKGAVHADITNMRFLLKDKAQDTANTQLRELKTHVKGMLIMAEGARSAEQAKMKQEVIVLDDTPTPKKPLLVLRTSPSDRSGSVSPSPSMRKPIPKSPVAVELNAKGGNVLSVSSRLTSNKRMEETKKLLNTPLDMPRPPSLSSSFSAPIAPFTPSRRGHAASAPATPKRINELRSTPGSSSSSKSTSFAHRLATHAQRSPVIGNGAVKIPKIKLNVASSGSTSGVRGNDGRNLNGKGERKMAPLKTKKKTSGFRPGGGGFRPREQNDGARMNGGPVGRHGEGENNIRNF